MTIITENTTNEAYSRRSFVKSAGIAASGLGALTLLGACSPETSRLQAQAKPKASLEGITDFFDIPVGQSTAEEALDKSNIKDLVEYERYCRDYHHYDTMASLYAEDSEVIVSWMEGTGAEFVEQTKQREKKRAGKGGHKLFNTVVWLNGDKAIAEIMCVILARFTIQGVDYDAPAYSRMLYRVERIDGIWKIKRFESVYEMDEIMAAFPVDSPGFDPALFEGFRESYKGICFLQNTAGQTPNLDLPGDDEPQTVAAMYKACSDWLFS